MTTEQRTAEYLRADAARNLQRIVEVAARMLGDDPHVGMAAIAAAADVSRATVYRNFPTREALAEAIRRQVLEQSAQSLADCRLEEGTATEALRRLVATWLEVAERYSFALIATQPGLGLAAEDREERRVRMGESLVALVKRGQAAGEFSSELPPEWAVRAFGALLLAGARAVHDGTLTRAEAADTVFTTLTKGLTA